jgi:hypothetical protein
MWSKRASEPWLGMSPTCWLHVGPTAKSRHIWPTGPRRADTNLFPTLFLCRGLPTFSKFSLSTRGTCGVIFVQTGIYIKQSVQPGYFFAPLAYYGDGGTGDDDVGDAMTTMATARQTAKSTMMATAQRDVDNDYDHGDDATGYDKDNDDDGRRR